MSFGQPVPELPVPNVPEAQVYYRDKFGFDIAWLSDEGSIGAVSYGETAIFFRMSEGANQPQTLWVFAPDVDATHADLLARGANVTDPLSNKPWGLRQFTVTDLNGHRFHFHHDL